jgi:hypothetical protein
VVVAAESLRRVRRCRTLVPNLEDALVRPIPVSVEAMRLLRGYLSVIENSPAIASPAAWHLVVTHIHDLIALAVGASRDAAEAARGRGWLPRVCVPRNRSSRRSSTIPTSR